MSYCRWSCLNGYCDVYVYEDVSGGWTTHVASVRQPPGAPYSSVDLAMLHAGEDSPAWQLYKACRKAAAEWREANPALPIDHPEAGARFNHETAAECAANLRRLAAEGFILPHWAVAALEKEDT